jgi:hypothetical protein
MYLLRLDDASDYLNIEKWDRIEKLLNKYEIAPIVGVIPLNKDKKLINGNKKDEKFWDKVRKWEKKNWTIAMHGCTHVYLTRSGGVNPINDRSEFAGLSLQEQKHKISVGLKVFQTNGVVPKIFFAPSHTFDLNTIEALRDESEIRIISDTVANQTYKIDDFYYIPVQAGKVRWLPFKIVTYCCHPNNMQEQEFGELEIFIRKNLRKWGSFNDLVFRDNGPTLYDKFLRYIYFMFRSIKLKISKS